MSLMSLISCLFPEFPHLSNTGPWEATYKPLSFSPSPSSVSSPRLIFCPSPQVLHPSNTGCWEATIKPLISSLDPHLATATGGKVVLVAPSGLEFKGGLYKVRQVYRPTLETAQGMDGEGSGSLREGSDIIM